MCLAIPARITEMKADHLAEVEVFGVTRDVSLDLVPDAGEGDYVLVHAGFAIEKIDEEYARETLDLIREMPELVAGDLDHVDPAELGRGPVGAEAAGAVEAVEVVETVEAAQAEPVGESAADAARA